MFQAMESFNITFFNETGFVTVVRHWYEEHGTNWTDTLETGTKQAFHMIDKDKNGKVSKSEIHHAIFNAMDTNGDGVWNLTEVNNFIKDYAEHLQRNLTPGW